MAIFPSSTYDNCRCAGCATVVLVVKKGHKRNIKAYRDITSGDLIVALHKEARKQAVRLTPHKCQLVAATRNAAENYTQAYNLSYIEKMTSSSAIAERPRCTVG